MKNGRPRPTLVPGAAIYANAFEQFSRPMTGHTPQKLPRFRAISCIIAVRVVIPTALSYDTTPLNHCQAFFRGKYQNLCSLFRQNRDLVKCTVRRHFWHLFQERMKQKNNQVILCWNHLVLLCLARRGDPCGRPLPYVICVSLRSVQLIKHPGIRIFLNVALFLQIVRFIPQNVFIVVSLPYSPHHDALPIAYITPTVQCQRFEHTNILANCMFCSSCGDLQDHVDMIRHDDIIGQADARPIRHLMQNIVRNRSQLRQTNLCLHKLISW